MNNLVIKKVTEDDAEKLIEYLKTIGGETDNLSFGKEGPGISVEEEKKFIRSIINNSNREIMLLGFIDDEIVSCTSMQSYSKERFAHRGELAVSVKKKYWNKGIGTRMIEEIIKFAKNINVKIIELEVKSDNISAIKLYKKMGFEKIGVYKNFSKIGEKYYDFDFMNLYL